MKSLLIGIITALLTGCATNQMAVTYYSDPPGATVMRPDGTSLGRAPITLNYQLTEQDKKQKLKKVQGLMAQWPSGAKIGYSSINAYVSGSTFTFKRPPDAPGLSTDMNYALELEKLAEMKRQTAAQQSAAWDASRAASAAEDSARAAKQRALNSSPPMPINCVNTGLAVTCF